MTNYLQSLSSVRLTRREFLVYLGAIFVGIIGIPSLLKIVGEVKPNKIAKITAGSRPFGSGAYGV